MYRYPIVQRRSKRLLAPVAAVALLLGLGVSPSTPAAASPAHAAVPAQAPNDPEGGTKALRDQLEAASRGFLEARTALETSKRRQVELDEKLKQLESDLASRTAALGEVVDVTYRTGRLGAMNVLLDSSSPDGFLERAAVLGSVAANEDRRLRELVQTKEELTRNRLALDNEIREQQKQLTAMQKRKAQAEGALKAAAAGGDAADAPDGSSGSTGSGTAQPARRTASGALPNESCSTDDPTTSGCITPRTLHAMNQAKAAGFTRFVSCFRSGNDGGEHPKGRACDFAAQKSGFGGVAVGGDRTYGNNLANYFVRNASRLGVLYVIWFHRIWLPSSGWRAYNGGGDPSSDHTNHVHLSVV